MSEKLESQSELLLEKQEIIEEKDREIEKLRNELKQSQDLLADSHETIREQDELIKLSNKPLPRKASKFKIFKAKIKSKIHHLVEKINHQNHELVAQVWVRN